jgi:hypothetical protein
MGTRGAVGPIRHRRPALRWPTRHSYPCPPLVVAGSQWPQVLHDRISVPVDDVPGAALAAIDLCDPQGDRTNRIAPCTRASYLSIQMV